MHRRPPRGPFPAWRSSCLAGWLCDDSFDTYGFSNGLRLVFVFLYSNTLGRKGKVRRETLPREPPLVLLPPRRPSLPLPTSAPRLAICRHWQTGSLIF